jgi:uncharacterized protein YjbI with pentapeptide repeats
MQQKLRWWLNSRHILLTIGVVAAIVCIIILIRIGYAYEWTGFGEYVRIKAADQEEFQRRKTLWDWLQLLIVPIVLAIGAYLFNQAAKRNEQQIAADNQQEAALQTYVDRMSELVIDQQLREKPADDAAWAVAQARTSTTLQRLDTQRKAALVWFLGQAQLLNTQHAGISLAGTPLQEANLQGANLQGTDLVGAQLQRANLTMANLQEANLQGANLQRAVLVSADLRRVQLQGAVLVEAQLQRAVLVEATLMFSNLRGADLTMANLQGAVLVGAQLQRTDLTMANLPEADLGGVENPTLELLQLAEFWGAQLQGTDLVGAQLQRAVLVKAQLQRANLTMANLQGANLQGANLGGAVLHGVENLTHEQLQEAITDEATELPTYLNIPLVQKAVGGPSEADAAGEQ